MTTAICIASGPSLTAKDVDYCRGKGKVYVINNTFKLASWADVLYGCDFRWWENYHAEAKKICSGEFWTVDERASSEYGVNLIGCLSDGGFWSRKNNSVALCGNGGHQAMNLAAAQGASKIILLGYDMKPAANGIRHWHGDHISALTQTNPVEYVNWVNNFKEASKMIDIPVINCTADTAIDCFERADLRAVL